MKVLVTGGAGYIGSHTCIELLASGFEPVVVDNFCNSKPLALARVERITNQSIPCYNLDITNYGALKDIFRRYDINAVLHFAGLKAVGESNQFPLHYYQNNIGGTLNLCRVMEEYGVKTLVFSSSATVYGDPANVPIRETFPTAAINPYGRSKLMVEEILRDLCAAPGSNLSVTLLRYFNPIGAHKSGLIGEDPQGIPNNLLPYVARVAIGTLPRLQVFGADYDTVDGTGVRDYIHVVDLARGHVKALEKMRQPASGCRVYNLGTGRGYSVLEVVSAFADISGKPISYDLSARRTGDIAACYADPSLAARELGWRAEFDLNRMLVDTWRWQSQNPNGYGD